MTKRIHVQSFQELDELFRELMLSADHGVVMGDEDIWVADTETNGLRPYHGDRIWGISLYNPFLDISWYIPVRYANQWNISASAYVRLMDLLSRQRKLIFFNAKFDLHMLEQDGLDFKGEIEDVILAAHLLNENEYISNGGQIKGAYQLKRLAKKYLGPEAVEGEEELQRRAKAKGVDPKSGMWQLPSEDVAFYAMKDVEITWQLREYYRPHLEEWQQWDLYQHKNKVLQLVIMRMERNGMMVDVDKIHEHINNIGPQVEELKAEFDQRLVKMGLKLTDAKETSRINLNSPMQVKAMFEAAGYELANTDQYTMRDMAAAGVDLAELLVDYRRMAKAVSNYYQPYLIFVDERGIIHHSLNLIGTVTRRLSSSEPNFQNIPRKNGKLRVKMVFIPRPGYVLLQFDYKALELRLGAHFAKELVMAKMLNDGGDPHQYTADMLGINRDDGKRYNFGLTYGMGYQKASRIYGMPLKKAKEQIGGWHKLYPAFRKALQVWEQKAHQWRTPTGQPGGNFQYVRLMNGITRHYNEFANKPEYSGEYRGAWNFVVQGTGAIVAEVSALRIAERFPNNDEVKLVNAVHDSIMIEVRRDKVNEVVPVVKELMEDWPQFYPKMEVEAEITDTSWYEMRKYKQEEWS